MSTTYNWSKTKLNEIIKQITPIKNDGLGSSPGETWSVKKLLALDYYIKGSHYLFRKYFDRWIYVDTHCGSGLILFKNGILKNEKFAGSPIITALLSKKYPFTDYYFCDIQKNAIDALDARLSALGLTNIPHKTLIQDFSTTVAFVEKTYKPKTAFLIFIDPVGFIEIEWALMQRLLKVPTADIFFTFMTHSLARHRSNADTKPKYAESLDQFYGNNAWTNRYSGDELLDLYLSQIAQYKKYVLTIPVYETGNRKLYDIVIATNSGGANNISKDATNMLNKTSTKTISGAFSVVAGKQTELQQYFQ